MHIGKYIKEIEQLDGNIKISEDSLFTNEIIGLIPKKIETTTTKTIIKNYDEYKYNIINNIFKDKNYEKIIIRKKKRKIKRIMKKRKK